MALKNVGRVSIPAALYKESENVGYGKPTYIWH
jgi:hypothetical protein